MFLNSLDAIPLNSRICIYGAGGSGERLKNILSKLREDIKVKYFIDSFKDGELSGLKVISMNNIHTISGEFDLIIVASNKWQEIEIALKDRNMLNYRILDPQLSFFLYSCSEFGVETVEMKLEDKNKLAENFNKAKNILTYESDKELFDLIINTRNDAANRKYLTEYTLKNLDRMAGQYLEFINKEKIKVMIEGGIYEGLTVLKFLDYLPNLKNFYGFEPFLVAYENGGYSSLLEKTGKVNVLPMALWENKDVLPMRSCEFASSVFLNGAPEGEIVHVEAISVDEFVQEKNIRQLDFLKLDVEGAEMNVLKGAENTILNHRPQLAICTYHSNSDMYEIPIYLNNLLDDYIYRLGHYTDCLLETVLYAIPKEFAD